jgi:hypothetical protein
LIAVLPAEITKLMQRRDVFTIAEAESVGVSATRVQRLAKAKLLTSLGRGVYTSKDRLDEADEWEEHAIRARGFAAACSTPVFVSGASAVAVRRLRHLGSPSELPEVIAPRSTRGGSTKTRYGLIRRAHLPAAHQKDYAGCPVVSKTWAAVDYARSATFAEALVVADAVLEDGATKVGMQRARNAMARWPGIEKVRPVIEHADGRSESVLETLGRVACIEGGLPVPISNAWVGRSRPEFRVDHLWRWHWVAAEADGALKYRDQDDPAAVVAREKERQWILERKLGLTVIRYGWDLAYGDRKQLAERFRAVLADNPPRPQSVPWWDFYDLVGEPITD